MPRKEQNEVSWIFLKGSDLADREKEVSQSAFSETRFIPQKLIQKSAWWGSKTIGAIHYLGTYENQPAVLKIQGVEQNTSEAEMLKGFTAGNRSQILRPPKLYFHQPWNQKKRYEVLITEAINGPKIINTPTSTIEVDYYFQLFSDYRANCRSQPWLDPPIESISNKLLINFEKWRQSSLKIYPDHPLRQKSDIALIDQAVAILAKEYKSVKPEFQHAHLSDSDMIQVDNQVVILSNLYWSWRPPFYDAIFAYHWFRYHLASVDSISPTQIENQKRLWLNQINKLPQNQEEKRLINLVLMERAAAGLNLDALSLDPSNPVSKYLVESTRSELESFLNEF